MYGHVYADIVLEYLCHILVNQIFFLKKGTYGMMGHTSSPANPLSSFTQWPTSQPEAPQTGYRGQGLSLLLPFSTVHSELFFL